VAVAEFVATKLTTIICTNAASLNGLSHGNCLSEPVLGGSKRGNVVGILCSFKHIDTDNSLRCNRTSLFEFLFRTPSYSKVIETS
jgi:hypothetical protein